MMVFRNLLVWKNVPPAGYHVFARLEYLLISLINYECQANFSKRALRDDPFSYLSISKIVKRAILLVWIIFIFYFDNNSLFFICFITLYVLVVLITGRRHEFVPLARHEFVAMVTML